VPLSDAERTNKGIATLPASAYQDNESMDSPTRRLFMKPAKRETEDCITGRFG
jgi:ABC-type phosphate transport system ATPase subunit